MGDIFSSEQSPFVKGGPLVDSVVVLNEILDLVKVSKRKSFVFRILRKLMTILVSLS